MWGSCSPRSGDGAGKYHASRAGAGRTHSGARAQDDGDSAVTAAAWCPTPTRSNLALNLQANGAVRNMEGISQFAPGGVARRARSRTRRRTGWVDRNFPRLAVMPTALVMLVVFGIPLLFSAWLSMEAWSPDQTLFGGSFAGSANYED